MKSAVANVPISKIQGMYPNSMAHEIMISYNDLNFSQLI
jgi:hypothetical protein